MQFEVMARLIFYSHDGYGIGHFRRNMVIARRLIELEPSSSVLLATGSKMAGHFDLADGKTRCQRGIARRRRDSVFHDGGVDRIPHGRDRILKKSHSRTVSLKYRTRQRRSAG